MQSGIYKHLSITYGVPSVLLHYLNENRLDDKLKRACEMMFNECIEQRNELQ